MNLVTTRPDLHTRAWREYRLALINAHGARCRACGRIAAGRGIHLCHLLGSPRTGAVLLLCRSCHARMDAPVTQSKIRRTLATKRGQLWLDPLIEFAPLSVREWPKEAVRDIQRSFEFATRPPDHRRRTAVGLIQDKADHCVDGPGQRLVPEIASDQEAHLDTGISGANPPDGGCRMGRL